MKWVWSDCWYCQFSQTETFVGFSEAFRLSDEPLWWSEQRGYRWASEVLAVNTGQSQAVCSADTKLWLCTGPIVNMLTWERYPSSLLTCHCQTMELSIKCDIKLNNSSFCFIPSKVCNLRPALQSRIWLMKVVHFLLGYIAMVTHLVKLTCSGTGYAPY